MLVAVLSCALLFRRQGKWQKKPGHAHRVIGCILSVIAIIGCVIASYAISKVRETVNAVTEKVQITAVIDVYVPKEDAAETVADAKGYTFAVTESFDWENTQKTLARMGELMGSEVKTVFYPTVFAMVDALYAGEVDGLIVFSSGVLNARIILAIFCVLLAEPISTGVLSIIYCCLLLTVVYSFETISN